MAQPVLFSFTLKPTSGLPLPNARLWLDLSEDFELQDGEEIVLSTLDRHSWFGQRILPEGKAPDSLFFMLRFVAPTGSDWTFEASYEGALYYQTQGPQKTSGNRETLTGVLRKRAGVPTHTGGRQGTP